MASTFNLFKESQSIPKHFSLGKSSDISSILSGFKSAAWHHFGSTLNKVQSHKATSNMVQDLLMLHFVLVLLFKGCVLEVLCLKNKQKKPRKNIYPDTHKPSASSSSSRNTSAILALSFSRRMAAFSSKTKITFYLL